MSNRSLSLTSWPAKADFCCLWHPQHQLTEVSKCHSCHIFLLQTKVAFHLKLSFTQNRKHLYIQSSITSGKAFKFPGYAVWLLGLLFEWSVITTKLYVGYVLSGWLCTSSSCYVTLIFYFMPLKISQRLLYISFKLDERTSYSLCPSILHFFKNQKTIFPKMGRKVSHFIIPKLH